MSSYTIQLRQLIDTYGQETAISWFTDYNISDYLNEEQVTAINESGWTKERLASEILDNYYMREIGLETPDAFIARAKIKMKRVMEEKLPIIYSNTLISNPLTTPGYTEEYEGFTNGTTQGNANNISSGLAVNSDTPQGEINKNDILRGKYASNTGATENSTTTSDSTSTNGTDKSTRKISGSTGRSASEALKLYRENIRAVNREIIDELGDLFMLIY